MKNKHRIAACCFAAVVLCALSGCSLARTDIGASATEDRLIGVLVTTECLDLFDMDQYLDDNLPGHAGGDIMVDGNTEKYQGKLYATMEVEALANRETGSTAKTERYVFEGIKGMAYFSILVPATAEHDSYYTTQTDDAISDSHTGYNVSDGGTAVTLEGTIYAAPNDKDCIFYLNPVYQSADGRVYVTGGTGLAMGVYDEDGNVMPQSDGTTATQTLDANYTVTENGKAKTDKISVKLTFSTMDAPKKIDVLQMDGNDTVVRRQEYAPGTMPETITPEPSTEYFIVETTEIDGSGKELVVRSLYGKDAATLDAFYSRADGICLKQQVQLNWPHS